MLLRNEAVKNLNENVVKCVRNIQLFFYSIFFWNFIVFTIFFIKITKRCVLLKVYGTRAHFRFRISIQQCLIYFEKKNKIMKPKIISKRPFHFLFTFIFFLLFFLDFFRVTSKVFSQFFPIYVSAVCYFVAQLFHLNSLNFLQKNFLLVFRSWPIYAFISTHSNIEFLNLRGKQQKKIQF